MSNMCVVHNQMPMTIIFNAKAFLQQPIINCGDYGVKFMGNFALTWVPTVKGFLNGKITWILIFSY